ncbi:ADP-forming succinate--CoA ligase subunit beta [Paenibacillus zanthoxyli]|uniref:ADP-forming succinate--CoA ligase subunit beta n=1 Tax=Paenibacillus zanthoxyli TaxID=369399 RepID=UPI00046FA2AF|nr:ADP-forming succinate--CoA ligase subunit beta [Paenibacillus zanthoxyli]
MNIHEHESKELLKAYGISVPPGHTVFTVEQAMRAAETLGSPVVVVKAQIHAGGRGKAGGVKIAGSLEEVRAYAEELLGKTLVTHQTGPEGTIVRRLLIEDGCSIAKEYYLGLVVDRSSRRVVMIGSEEGGMDIEEVAASRPERIHKETIDPAIGIQTFQARRLAYAINIPGEKLGEAVKLMQALYKAFIDYDCSIAEINPLVITGEGALMALDAKLNIDENALFRQPDITLLHDPNEEDPLETEAAEYGLSYISLDGSIGCMVNGAGLAMATMDMIKLHGGEPANFLDVGGGASADKVAAAFKIILSDPRVKGILVNIFGGIMRCDVIASGVVEAARQVGLSHPLVVRLEGTNAKSGRQILADSGIGIISSDSMEDSVREIVSLVQ